MICLRKLLLHYSNKTQGHRSSAAFGWNNFYLIMLLVAVLREVEWVETSLNKIHKKNRSVREHVCPGRNPFCLSFTYCKSREFPRFSQMLDLVTFGPSLGVSMPRLQGRWQHYYDNSVPEPMNTDEISVSKLHWAPKSVCWKDIHMILLRSMVVGLGKAPDGSN